MSVLQDLRFAVRLLSRDRGFTAAATLALALGIGLNATVFTVVDAILVRSLPFDDPDRVMYLGERDVVNGHVFGISWLDLQDWRRSQTCFSDLAAWSVGTMNVSDEGRAPERYNGAYFSANAFKALGYRPIRGRDFLAEDDTPGGTPVVMLGYGIWNSRYRADPSLVGRTIVVNDIPATVVGVMPEAMGFPDADLWMPLSSAPGLAAQTRDQRFGMQAFGRLRPGVSRQQAQTELAAVAARLEHDFAGTNRHVGARVITFTERLTGGPIRLVLLAAMGAVGFVLLVACANVASLLLVRSTERAKEVAVRVAIGATRWRIVRQLLVESVLLAGMGGVFGWLLAICGTRWFDTVTQDVGRPYFLRFTMDGPVFAFFATVCLLTGIIFGLAPALHMSRTDINDVIKEGGRGGRGGRRARRWTGVLIVAELTLTLVLLAGAGLMVRSFLTLYRIDAGIETAHLLSMNLSLPARKYPTPERRAAFYDRLDERLGAVAMIRGGTVASSLPFGGGATMRLSVEGRPAPAGEPPQITVVAVGPRYFEIVGLRLTRGRAFASADGDAGRENGIVNQRFVSMYFGSEDPIGRRIRLASDPPGRPEPAWITIVGVSPTVRQRNLREPDPDPVVYVPYRFAAAPAMSLLIRTEGEPSAMTSALREEVRKLDPDLALFGIATMDARLAQTRWSYRVFGTMFFTFAVVALVLSAVGLYAITAYSVRQRTQEIGIRMALGAQAQQVWWLIVRRSFGQLAIGLTLGMAGALGAGRLLRSLLVQTSAADPLTLGTIAILFAIVSLAACHWPARRATEVDPIAALRHE